MRIVVDAFGGDNAPVEIIKGASMASLADAVEITLTGNPDTIAKVISDYGLSFYGELKTVATDKVLSMHDDPTSLVKANRDSSLGLAFTELVEERADALVSAGSTGAIVVGGTLLVKRLKGIKRPALAGLLPTKTGGYCLLLDMGANAECRPEMLDQFALMASVYQKAVMGIKSPRIALLNIGSEETKGDTLRQEAYALMRASDRYCFVGNVESREVLSGDCDAIVTDGFTGNITLKLIEGTAKTLFSKIKTVMTASLPNKLAALVLKKDLYRLKQTMDSSEVGGAPLLGVQKPVVKAHGNSDAKAIKNAVHQAKVMVETNMVQTVAENL